MRPRRLHPDSRAGMAAIWPREERTSLHRKVRTCARKAQHIRGFAVLEPFAIRPATLVGGMRRGSELGHSAMIKRDTHERNPLRGVPACLPSRIEAEGDSAGEAVLALRR